MFQQVQMRMEDALYRAVVQNLEGLKSLEIGACAFASYGDLVKLVASFPQLRSLAASFDKSQPEPLPLLQPASPPKKLRALRFTGPLTGTLKALFSWLRTAEDVHIESLVYYVKSDDPLDLLQDMLGQLGPSLQHLELQVDADEALDRTCRLLFSLSLHPDVPFRRCPPSAFAQASSSRSLSPSRPASSCTRAPSASPSAKCAYPRTAVCPGCPSSSRSSPALPQPCTRSRSVSPSMTSM